MNRTYLYYFLIVCISGLMFTSASANLALYGLLFSAVLFLVVGFILIQDRSVNIPKIIVILLVFQNLLIGTGAHMGNNQNDSLSYLTQVPFLCIAISGLMIILISFLKKTSNTGWYLDKRFFLLYCIVIFSLIISPANFDSKLINVRNLTTFYFAYIIGKHCLATHEKFKSFSWFLIKISTFVVLAGVFLYFQNYSFWKKIGIEEVYIAKKFPLNGDFEGRFSTILIDSSFTRMASIYYEPVNLGYLLSAAFLLALSLKWRDPLIKFIFCFILLSGQILTFGKGAYLITLGVIASVYGEKVLNKLVRKFKVHKIIIFFTLSSIGAFSVFYYQVIGGSAKPHFWGIIQTFESVLTKPLGYGLGMGGNGALTFGVVQREAWLSSGGESALMSFTYQLGIPFSLLLIICFMKITNSIYKSDMGQNVELIGVFGIFKYVPFVVLCMSLFQDNTFTPQCITMFMLLAGGVSGYNKNDTNKIKSSLVNSSLSRKKALAMDSQLEQTVR